MHGNLNLSHSRLKPITGGFMVILLMLLLLPAVSSANAPGSMGKEPAILVAYTNETGEKSANVKMLDMLIGHFSSNIVYKDAKNVTRNDLSHRTHLFYYGEKNADIPASFHKLSSHFKGTYVAIGANVEQLGKPFQFVHTKGEVKVKELLMENRQKVQSLSDTELIFNTRTDRHTNTLMEARYNEQVYPLLVQRKSMYYFSRIDFDGVFMRFLGEGLHHIFQSHDHDAHPAYLRLEDVHPMADPKKLMEIAKYLKGEHIPYMIAVIPVFKDPTTHKEYHFSDTPKVVKALQYMQKNGGSIVMHGYTHQYRSSETGEGFEFWDLENNTPIFQKANDTASRKKRKQFPDDRSYQAYLTNLAKFEKKYIKNKLTKGIQELTEQRLYPLAFEAPHYTMSEAGYKMTSDLFSTYVGQVQLSNTDWRVMQTAPYVTSPSFLGGMKLLPETIGFVPQDTGDGIADMMKHAQQQLITEGGIVSGFYHPYLGVEGLKNLIDQLQQMDTNLAWMDLKHMKNKVQADEVTITSGPDGINVTTTLVQKGKFDAVGQTIGNITIWIVASLVIIGMALFLIFIFKSKNVHKQDHYWKGVENR